MINDRTFLVVFFCGRKSMQGNVGVVFFCWPSLNINLHKQVSFSLWHNIALLSRIENIIL